MIKAVIFDFYGVIISDPMWGVIQREYHVAGDTFHQLSDNVNLGKLTWDEFVQQLADATGKDVKEVSQAYTQYHVNCQVITLIKELSEHYKVGLLTNASHGHIDAILGDLDVSDLFDSVVVSADLRIIKPQPGIYERSLSDLAVYAEEAVFIDDNAINTDGAAAVGMHALLFSDYEQLKNELEVLLAQ